MEKIFLQMMHNLPQKVMKNFVSKFLLNRFGFKPVYEFDMFILFKDVVFVGKKLCLWLDVLA